MPAVEALALALAIGIGAITYFILTRERPGQRLLTPPLVALLLVANLVPWISILVLLGRRVAKRRAANSGAGGRGRLHVRLVALFSLVASVPMLLVTIFASLLFQYGVEFWFSDRARGILENASSLAQGYNQERSQEVASETLTMASDLRGYLSEAEADSPRFAEGYGWQVLSRHLNESAIVEVDRGGVAKTIAMVNPDARPVERRVSAAVISQLSKGAPVVVTLSPDRIEAVTRLFPKSNSYLYASRIADKQGLAQTARAKAVLADYDVLLERSRALQVRFNAALFFVSLLIIGAAVWIALNVADRLVRPVNELVDAAGRITAGDLSARVPTPRNHDEVATLANAFNRMARRLQEQTGALVNANDLLDRRRAFTEAVLSGVTAGVIAVGEGRKIRLVNSSAEQLLKIGEGGAAGKLLADIAPELDRLVDTGDRESIVQVATGEDVRTLAVKIAADEVGYVLTFDDITQQLNDQRRAAWSDVARRVAHEIKNPLTPIQLAAERLKRRYAKDIVNDGGTFEKLTDTIVRQVGDLRRMVDEFSSFARMPKPVFRDEALIDIARQALFLHEVAHPSVKFQLRAPDPSPMLVCDRRQLGQALTNIVKNAVEAIEEQGQGAGTVELALSQRGTGTIRIDVSDTGIGLPADRARLVEPYMTTRARGTGLGLAIVKKIIEEHLGNIDFADRPEGGTIVSISFDPAALRALTTSDQAFTEMKPEPIPPELTRARSV
jgi:two-component system, NtrC family, nitrogen regulation sensor histidine kinase NtrY